MWTKLRLKLLQAIPPPGRLLASWQLSVGLMVIAGLYYLLLAVWSTMTAPPIVQSIARMVPFWILYALLLLNTCFCLWRRLPALRRDLASASLAERREPRWERQAKAVDQRVVRRELTRAGYYTITKLVEPGLRGARGRWAPLGPFLFHSAFLIIAAAFLLTLAYRREVKLRVAVGEEFTGSPDQVIPPGQNTVVPASLRFRIDEIRPEFWRDQLLFTRLEARLRFADGDRRLTRINRPLWLSWGRFLRLSNFGYAPRYELLSSQGQVLEGAFVKMNVFPPGQRDSFRPGQFPHRAYLDVLPDADLRDSTPRNLSLRLKNPLLRVEVLRGKLALAQARLRLGQAITFEGLRLRFPEIRYWGELALVEDPGAPLLFVGFIVALLGLLLRLRGGRAEIEWRPAEDGGPSTLRGWGDAWPPRGLISGEEEQA